MCVLEGQCHKGAEHTQRTAARVAKPGLRLPIGGGVFACMNCPEPRGQTGLEFYCDSDLWGNLIEPHPTEISFRWHSQYNSTSVPSWELTGKLPNHNAAKYRFQYPRVCFVFFSFYWLLFIGFQNLHRTSVPFLCESSSGCLKISGMTMSFSTIIPESLWGWHLTRLLQHIYSMVSFFSTSPDAYIAARVLCLQHIPRLSILKNLDLLFWRSRVWINSLGWSQGFSSIV